ncbi:MAG TPA: alpha/beta hydrolase [Marinagarivorans sp.]
MTTGGCSSAAKIWNWMSVNTAQTVKRDVLFNEAHGLATDIYYANTENQPSKGTIIFIYGGSWRSGNKELYGFLADGLGKYGYDVVIPSYRLYPNAAYPEFVQDVADFMQWYADNAQAFNLSLDNLYLMGHSAGAYNAAMYLTDPSYAKPLSYQAFIGLAGPYDFFLPTEDPKYIPIFTENGPFNVPNSMPAHQPGNNLAKIVKRALLLHGKDDTIVTPKNIASFGQYLTDKNVAVQTRIYDDVDHKQLVSAVNNVPFVSHNIRDEIIAFIEKDSLDNK